MKTIRPPWIKLVREGAAAPPGTRIGGPGDVARLLAPRAASELVEVFYAIALASDSRVIAVTEVTRGTLNSSLVHAREVFRFAITLGAAGVVVAHNHPSGNPTPSTDDKNVTRTLVESGRILDIPVYDHVVLGAAGRYVSFAEAGLL